ncbi:zinc-finger of the MIZ type in Nse subunit-domain-containing protein, partial [Blyttiomyces helicus]
TASISGDRFEGGIAAEFERRVVAARKRKGRGGEVDAAEREFEKKVWEARWPGKPFRGAGAAEEEVVEEEEDIVMGEARKAWKCPITQRPLEDPVTSFECEHSYSRAAIADWFKQQGQHKDGRSKAECPVAGCRLLIDFGKLKRDRDLEKEVARRLAEMEAAAQEEEFTMVDEDS